MSPRIAGCLRYSNTGKPPTSDLLSATCDCRPTKWGLQDVQGNIDLYRNARVDIGTGKPACWTPREVAAAQVRDFDTMLMVSALRCRFASMALLGTYNAMVVRHRSPLTDANLLLKAHFASGHGGVDALDSYITRVANRYGAGADGLSCGSLRSIAEAALAEPPTLAALTALSARASVKPELPGGVCDAAPMQVATAQ